jgi:hypothetical protein
MRTCSTTYRSREGCDHGGKTGQGDQGRQRKLHFEVEAGVLEVLKNVSMLVRLFCVT